MGTECRITVFFEDPFWVGIYERETDTCYEVCKITFGAEPKDYAVYDFLLCNWHRLRFGLSMEAKRSETVHRNPKRLQREVKKQLAQTGTGTKAQQALQLQREQNRTAWQERSRAQRDAESQRQFALRQHKRKEKHRGH